MTRNLLAGLLLLVTLTACGAASPDTVDAPRADGRPPYTTPLTCLHAIDAAAALIQGATVPTISTSQHIKLVDLINRAFRAGSHDDLAAGQRILDDLDLLTAPGDENTAELVHKFTIAADDCRN